MKQLVRLQNATRGARRVALIATGLFVSACSDTAGPDVQDTNLPVADGSFNQHLKWANAPTADQFRAVANLPGGPVELTPNAAPAVLLDGDWYDWDGEDLFSVSFYAIRGEEREINVELNTETGTIKFLELEITEPTVPVSVLQFNYAHAQSGWNENDLAVWYQPTEGEAWNEEPTEINMKKNRVLINLYHFSNYAVAW